jgi:AMP-activated protein kinase-like protein
MTREFHPLVKRLLDGELGPADLPPELRPEGEEALRLLSAVDRRAVTLPAALEARVMAAVRGRAASRAWRAWRWISTPRELEFRLRVRPWAVAALAVAAVLALYLSSVVPPLRNAERGPGGEDPPRASVLMRFVLYAPGAHRVALAGTFNQWDREATPLVPAGGSGVWTTTLALAPGQHQYAFVVDGERWVADPAAPAVDDGFGRRNSVVAVAAPGERVL